MKGKVLVVFSGSRGGHRDLSRVDGLSHLIHQDTVTKRERESYLPSSRGGNTGWWLYPDGIGNLEKILQVPSPSTQVMQV